MRDYIAFMAKSVKCIFSVVCSALYPYFCAETVNI
jgi:hypothetical protein